MRVTGTLQYNLLPKRFETDFSRDNMRAKILSVRILITILKVEHMNLNIA